MIEYIISMENLDFVFDFSIQFYDIEVSFLSSTFIIYYNINFNDIIKYYDSFFQILEKLLRIEKK